MSKPPILFYSRCKPQRADALEIALDNNIVFIGYPMWRDRRPGDERNVLSWLVPPNAPSDEWNAARAALRNGSPREYAKNRNMVGDVVPGSIALIPRPEFGVVFAGVVTNDFEVVDDPEWEDAYLALRARQNLNSDVDARHVGDVAQIWRVDGFREIPVPDVPGWIRGSLFGRSTYARIKKNIGDLTAFKAMDDVLRTRSDNRMLDWSNELGDIELRLATRMAPSNFEHLIVSLIQLENPEQRWFQVGGSGDGGADGLGYDNSGNLIGVLQCKLSHPGGVVRLRTAHSTRSNARHYFATLLHSKELSSDEGVELFGRERIAALVQKHAERLPEAIALRIGRQRT